MSDKCALCRVYHPGSPQKECGHPVQIRHIEQGKRFSFHEDTLRVMPEFTGLWIKSQKCSATNLETGEHAHFGSHVPVVPVNV
jgi:hypothetical protein